MKTYPLIRMTAALQGQKPCGDATWTTRQGWGYDFGSNLEPGVFPVLNGVKSPRISPKPCMDRDMIEAGLSKFVVLLLDS